MNNIRIDLWLWAVRIFKTRSRATAACRAGKVTVSDNIVKPSRSVHIGELVIVKQKPIYRLYKVQGLAGKRVSAKIAADLVQEITPEEELEKLKQFYRDPLRFIFAPREKGAGRPTKKERRKLEDLKRDQEK